MCTCWFGLTRSTLATIMLASGPGAVSKQFIMELSTSMAAQTGISLPLLAYSWMTCWTTSYRLIFISSVIDHPLLPHHNIGHINLQNASSAKAYYIVHAFTSFLCYPPDGYQNVDRFDYFWGTIVPLQY